MDAGRTAVRGGQGQDSQRQRPTTVADVSRGGDGQDRFGSCLWGNLARQPDCWRPIAPEPFTLIVECLTGPVAQWSEPTAHNGLVGGSSPPGPTNILMAASGA